MTVELIILVLLTFMISALIKGWSGFGTNLIAMPVLATMLGYEWYEAVTIVVTVNIFMNVAILVENKKFNLESLKEIWVLVLFGVIFTFVGQYYLKNADNADAIKIVAGAVIILTALNKLFKFSFTVEHKERWYIPVGIISGIFNGIAGLGGLPVLVLLSNSDMEKNKFRTTLVTYFLIMNVVAVIGFVSNSFYSGYVFTYISIVVVPAVVICMIGVYLSRRVSDKAFSTFMLYLLLFFGTNLIVNGLFHDNIIGIIYKMF